VSWGWPFVVAGAFLASAYVASGVAFGRRRGSGTGGSLLEAHPHFSQWQAVGGLVSDGIAFSKRRGAGGASSRRQGQQPPPGRAGTESSEALLSQSTGKSRKEKRSSGKSKSSAGAGKAANESSHGSEANDSRGRDGSMGKERHRKDRGGSAAGAAGIERRGAGGGGGAAEAPAASGSTERLLREQVEQDERLHQSQAKIKVVGLNG
jgi:hypothetical protein